MLAEYRNQSSARSSFFSTWAPLIEVAEIPAAVLEARHTPAIRSRENRTEFEFAPQLRVHFEPETRAMWSRWMPEPRPCFNLRSWCHSYFRIRLTGEYELLMLNELSAVKNCGARILLREVDHSP